MNEVTMREEERVVWLEALAPIKLRALASQNSVVGWATLSPKKLVQRLSLVDGVEVPVYASTNR